jgi:hypothetical protein
MMHDIISGSIATNPQVRELSNYYHDECNTGILFSFSDSAILLLPVASILLQPQPNNQKLQQLFPKADKISVIPLVEKQ